MDQPLWHALLLVPAAVAALMAWRAARDTNFWERSFWRLLAAASAARGLSVALSALPSLSAVLAARFAADTQAVLSLVALLVRPDHPRDAGERRAASLEWLMAGVAGYFIASSFGVATIESRRALSEAVPALVAAALASRMRQPFRRLYAILTLGLGASAALSLWPSWRVLSWILPLLAVAVAAELSRQQDWVRPPWEGSPRRAAWLAPLAIALPPLVELATLTSERRDPDSTVLALASTLLLFALAAIRIHPRVIALPSQPTPDEPASAADSLEFASRVAHELNNPLMAVAGLAELALKKATSEAPLRRLIADTSTAAGIVTRLHQITGRSKGVGG